MYHHHDETWRKCSPSHISKKSIVVKYKVLPFDKDLHAD